MNSVCPYDWFSEEEARSRGLKSFLTARGELRWEGNLTYEDFVKHGAVKNSEYDPSAESRVVELSSEQIQRNKFVAYLKKLCDVRPEIAQYISAAFKQYDYKPEVMIKQALADEEAWNACKVGKVTYVVDVKKGIWLSVVLAKIYHYVEKTDFPHYEHTCFESLPDIKACFFNSYEEEFKDQKFIPDRFKIIATDWGLLNNNHKFYTDILQSMDSMMDTDGEIVVYFEGDWKQFSIVADTPYENMDFPGKKSKKELFSEFKKKDVKKPELNMEVIEDEFI